MGLRTAQVPLVRIVLTRSDTFSLLHAIPSESCFRICKQSITNVLILSVTYEKFHLEFISVAEDKSRKHALPNRTVRPDFLTPCKNRFRGICPINHSKLLVSLLPPFIQLYFLPAHRRSPVYNMSLNKCLLLKYGFLSRILSSRLSEGHFNRMQLLQGQLRLCCVWQNWM